MLQDLKISIRGLRRAPIASLAAVCTLALAIGASAAVFSVIDKVLLRPLPLHEPDRVVVIWPRERANPTTIGEISHFAFRSWQEETRSFTTLAAVGSTNWSLILREGDSAMIPVAAVSASFFPLLGTAPVLGRTLRPEDDRQGSERVAVMSHSTWVGRFGSDARIIGRRVRFQDAAYTIVGVMPEGFDYPRGAEMWLPVVPQLVDAGKGYETDLLTEPGFAVLFVLGRLAPGVTLESARGEVSSLIERGAGTAFRAGMEAALTPLPEHIFGSTRPALLALATCVVLVLFIGCANVAVLLLARAALRADEITVRLAIGASRWRVMRESLADALLLSSMATAIGVGLAYWCVKALLAIAPADVPRLDAVRFDSRTVVFALLLCVLTAGLVGLVPGLHASWRTLARTFAGSGMRVVRANRLRRAFVVTQVGLAIVLLVFAGLVGRSFVNLLRVDIGFDPTNVLTLNAGIPDASKDRTDAFYAQLLTQVRALPGVIAAGAVYQRPLEYAGIGMDASFLVEGQNVDPELREGQKNPLVNLESITPGYLEAIGTRIVRGRAFTDADTMPAPRVAIMSERLAQRLWPGQDPIGKRILPPGQGLDGQGNPRWATVVGIAQDARYRGIGDPRFDLYLPHLQMRGMPVQHLMVRASGDPLALAGPIRAVATRLDSTVLVERVRTMGELVDRATAPWRFSTWTLGLLGTFALLLTVFGVFAILSQSVVERTPEIGVRIAVGARPGQIACLIIWDGLALTMAGLVLGSSVAAVAGSSLRSLLYGVEAVDPLTLIAVAGLVLAISAVVMLLAGARAARLNPTIALRA